MLCLHIDGVHAGSALNALALNYPHMTAVGVAGSASLPSGSGENLHGVAFR